MSTHSLTKHWSTKLEKFSPCTDALEWARKQKSPAAAWKSCQRGDWMLWMLGKLDKSEPYSNERRPLVAIACECSRTAEQWMPQASKDALAVVERWAGGDDSVTSDDLSAAESAAEAAARAAAGAAEAAAWAAAGAAEAAAGAADAAAWAADAAARAADAAARAAARAKFSDIVRKHYPTAPRLT